MNKKGKVLPQVENHMYVEDCPSCGGTGMWGYGRRKCYTCKGTGKKRYKTSPEARAKSRAYAAKRKAKNSKKNLENFAEKYPVVWNWMKDSDFNFAVSIRSAVEKYGNLTEKTNGSSQAMY